RSNFNILVAHETKASGTHWEIFTEAGTGNLSVYCPGLEPDHLRSSVDVCDGVWRQIALRFAVDHMALYVDGELVAEQAVRATGRAAVPGGLAIGRLVEGGIGCAGALDDVRISSGLRPIAKSDVPLVRDAETKAIWNFD